jgi:hypothetical protein
MSHLREITALAASTPHLMTPPDVAADWYQRKAELCDAIAAHPDTDPVTAVEMSANAALASAHAATLRARYGSTQ